MNEPDPVEQTAAKPERFERPVTVWTFVKYVAVQLLIFSVLYILSIGPMFWQWYGGRNLESNSLVAAFYEPLYRIAGWCEPFGEFMNWYVDLWIG